jgi:hypothetical protein
MHHVDSRHLLEEFTGQMYELHPVPDEANVSWPGFAFASAIKSLTEVTPRLSGTHKHDGAIADLRYGRKVTADVESELRIIRMNDRLSAEGAGE